MKISNFDISLVQTSNRWVERIFANLESVMLIDGILYVRYIGKEESLNDFRDAYKKYLPEMLQSLYSYGVKAIKSDKEIDNIKLSWLKSLIETFEPKKVEFSLKK